MPMFLSGDAPRTFGPTSRTFGRHHTLDPWRAAATRVDSARGAEGKLHPPARMCLLHTDTRRSPRAERSAPAPNMRSRAPTCASEQGELGSQLVTQWSGGRSREPLTQVRTPAGAFTMPRVQTTRSHIEHAHDLRRSYPKQTGRARVEPERPGTRKRGARTTHGAHACSPNGPGCTRVEPKQPRAHTRGARTTHGAYARNPHVRTKLADDPDVPQMWTGLRLN